MQTIIHINRVLDCWQAKPENSTPLVVSRNKSDVIAQATHLARNLSSSAVLVIHGKDGRILEKRTIPKS